MCSLTMFCDNINTTKHIQVDHHFLQMDLLKYCPDPSSYGFEINKLDMSPYSLSLREGERRYHSHISSQEDCA